MNLQHAKQMNNDLYPSRASSRPGWILRNEPVIHSVWSETAPFSRITHATFERDGFIVVEGVFSNNEVKALQNELEYLRDHHGSLDPQTVIQEPGEESCLRSIFSIHSQSTLFGRLVADGRLTRIARYILGDEVYVYQSRLNYKPGFDGKEFYWHSDFETWHVEDGMPRMRALSMSLLLSENTSNNGPLMFIPGSHKYFISCVGDTPDEHYKLSLRKQEIGVPDRDSLTRLAVMSEITAPIGKPGSLIIFDCNLIHGSNGNITPWPRANVFIVYNAVSNAVVEPFGGKAPRPAFITTRELPDALSARKGQLLAENE